MVVKNPISNFSEQSGTLTETDEADNEHSSSSNTEKFVLLLLILKYVALPICYSYNTEFKKLQKQLKMST